MGDQLGEVELHVVAGFGSAEPGAVDVRHQRQMQLAVAPGIVQLVGGDEHRRQRRTRLGLHETKALGELGRNQVAQRDIVDQPDQLDVRCCLLGRSAHRHIVGDDHNLRFQVDAVVLADHLDGIARAIEAGAGGLVHQWVGVEAFRHFGIARAAHPLHMRQVGAAVDELIGARQRGGQGLHIQIEHTIGAAVVERGRQGIQARRHIAPVLQRTLQGGRDASGAHGGAQVARDHDQAAVATAFLQGT